MLDRLSTIQNILTVTGCSSRALAAIADVSIGSVSNYLSGVQSPDSARLDRLYKAAIAIEKLAALAIPPDWTKVAKVKPLIEKIIAGGSVEITVVESPLVTEQLFALFLDGSYFQNRTKDALGRWQIGTTRAPANALILIREDADRLKDLLVAAGYRAQIVPSKEEFADCLEDAWGEPLNIWKHDNRQRQFV